MQGKSVSEVYVLFIACIDAFYHEYDTSKSLNNIHDFMFQWYCYVYLNLTCKKISFFYPVNLNKSSWSSGMVDRQKRQS